MRFLPILALLCLVTPAFGAESHAPGTCYQKTITVCVPKKPKVKKHPLVVVQQPPAPTPPSVVVPPLVVPPIQVTITPIRTVERRVDVPCNREHVKDCKKDKDKKVVVGGYVALGVGVRDQYVQGNIGLQLEFPKARLGLRIFSALDKGVGAQALIYPYRSERVKVHIIDPGVLVTDSPFNLTNNTDVPRRVDLLLGAGVQVKLVCHLDLTVDWRVNIADPGMLVRDDGKVITSGPHAGTYLDAAHVTGNSFSSSQVMLGLLLHI
jgi:hypothetical protein